MYFINVGVAPGSVEKLNPEQMLSRQTWESVPDANPLAHSILGSLTRVRQVRNEHSTTTLVNPMEPMHENGQNKWADSTPIDKGCCDECAPRQAVHY